MKAYQLRCLIGSMVAWVLGVLSAPALGQFGGVYLGDGSAGETGFPAESFEGSLAVPDGAGQQTFTLTFLGGSSTQVTMFVTISGNSFTGTVQADSNALVTGSFSGATVTLSIADPDGHLEFTGSRDTALGACIVNGQCSQRSEGDCAAAGGSFQGEGTVCPSQAIRWKEEDSGREYEDPGHWDPEIVPVNNAQRSDTAVFDLATSALSPPLQITASNATAGKWIVSGMAVDFAGPGAAQVFGSDNPNEFSLEIGLGGQLGVVDGFTLTSLDTLIGLGGEESKVFVIGPASRWTNTGLLTIGAASEATVTVRERGTLVAQDAIEVGNSGGGTCTLTVESGGSVEAAELVAGKGQTHGTITVRGVEAGARSTLQLSETLRIGNGGGSGQLFIEDGGRVLAPVVNVGEETVNGGEQVTISGIHAASGRRSTLLITGTDRIFSVGGDTGTQVEVKDGGSLVTFDADIGDQARSGKVVVHNPDSDLPSFDPDNDTGGAAWIDGGLISVGSLTEASEIVIQDRGVVGAIAMDIGRGAFQIGRVTVSGEDALLEAGELTVGSFGSGELQILSGAKVKCETAGVGVSPEPGSSNTTDPNAVSRVIIDGNLIDESRWEISGDLNVGVNGGVGQVTLLGVPILANILAAGATVQVGGTVTVSTGGIIQGIGTLDADNRVVNGGIIVPGLSPGILVIDGDYEQLEGGTLVMEAAGLEPGQFDILKITGSARLGGTMQVKFIDGFVPQPGDAIPFVQIDGAVEGQFARVQVQGLPEGLSLAVDPLTGAVTVQNGPPGAQDQCGEGTCGAGGGAILPMALIGMARQRRRKQRGR